MTREEAISEISKIIFELGFEDTPSTDKRVDALNMAIEALEEELKIGHWVKTPKAVMGEGYMWYCDKCEHQVYQDSSRPYPSEKYCPNCGAKMIEPQESEG